MLLTDAGLYAQFYRPYADRGCRAADHESFQLTDAQWGLLYGPPFAIFYAIMGLPIALWADRSNRVHIISLCIVLWSIMTALCGVAVGFFSLLLFRIGVAIGEAAALHREFPDW